VTANNPEVSLVVPCHNEAENLSALYGRIRAIMEKTGKSWEMVCVNDGSTDDTLAFLRQMAKSWPHLRVVATPHGGKGAAVRAGMLFARGELRLLCDADLSTPIAEVRNLRDQMLLHNADIAIASRALPDSRVLVSAPWRRVLMGRVYNRLVRFLLLPDLRDTQCGFKLFTATAAIACFSELSCQGFGFDVEALTTARRRHFAVIEVPSVWRDAAGSHVSSSRDSLVMLLGLLRLRFRAYGLRRLPQNRIHGWG
jgi:dolichyl-phosphate beta-glucosyltransferase